MKKVGILLRKDEVYHMNLEIVSILERFNCLPIGIVSNNLSAMIESLSFVDGIILQGGKSYTDVEIEFVKYLYDMDIPVLGICLGMQMMGIMKNGILKSLNNSKHNSHDLYVHRIFVKQNSKLYSILKNNEIYVNSRHNDCVYQTDLTIVAISNDGVIEAIEDSQKMFFLGVQWHPESLMDKYSNSLFKAFIDSI